MKMPIHLYRGTKGELVPWIRHKVEIRASYLSVVRGDQIRQKVRPAKKSVQFSGSGVPSPGVRENRPDVYPCSKFPPGN